MPARYNSETPWSPLSAYARATRCPSVCGTDAAYAVLATARVVQSIVLTEHVRYRRRRGGGRRVPRVCGVTRAVACWYCLFP
eukprot:449636-Rhodomonas_salina.1